MYKRHARFTKPSHYFLFSNVCVFIGSQWLSFVRTDHATAVCCPITKRCTSHFVPLVPIQDTLLCNIVPPSSSSHFYDRLKMSVITIVNVAVHSWLVNHLQITKSSCQVWFWFKFSIRRLISTIQPKAHASKTLESHLRWKKNLGNATRFTVSNYKINISGMSFFILET